MEENLCVGCPGNCCSKKSGDKFVTKENIAEIEAAGYMRFYHKKKGSKFCVLNKRGDYCIFYDTQKNGCTIYNIRPADCRIFPYDTIMRDGKYFWILWEWEENECVLRKCLDHEKHLEALERDVIPKFAGYLGLYSMYTEEIIKTNKKKYRILREIRFRGKQ